MKPVFEQAKVNALNDADLLERIGVLWESIKQVDEAMAADPHIVRVLEELAEYKLEKYLEEKKAYKANLKAARLVAKARGLKVDVPTINNRGDDDDA